MSAPFVCIYASQVAMCIGANRHKKICEAMELMWQRIDPASYRSALRRNGQRTEEEITEGILASHAELRDLVDQTLTVPCESSDQVARKYDCVARELAAVPLAEEDRRLVDDVLKRNLYTSYGNLHEHSALTYIRDTLGIRCGPDPTFYKAQQGTVVTPGCTTVPWYVGGKIDAIDDDKTLLIEIKNRVNRLFYRVPFYEHVQVQAYLELLDLDKGVLVECLKTSDTAQDRGPPTSVNVIPVERDRTLWRTDIVPKLQGFVDFLVRLLYDTAFQDRYMASKRRQAMITAHVATHPRA